jgi:hypothetical protein
MAIGTFFHSEPNDGPNKSQISGAGPDGITDALGNVCGIATQYGDSQILTCSGFTGSLLMNGNLTAQGTTHTLSGTVNATTFIGNLNGVASGNKTLASFDIPHVNKKGKRIRHIVAEGPEPGIYIRGKLNGSNIIELPEYWDGLVDPDTITVTLTQIGTSQDLIVQDIKDGTVTLRSGTNEKIHCFYEVWVARWLNPMNHEDKLHVIYDGKSPDDYPDGNDNFLIGGWDYDRRNSEWTPQ